MPIQLFFTSPALFLVVIIAIIIALSFHEFCHALAANLLGDTTAERMGRLTLNPLAHIDWKGFAALVFVGFGWAKPVPFNPYNLRARKWGPVLVSIAGPLSNLFLALVATVLSRLLTGLDVLSSGNALIVFLQYSVLINLALMFFNFLPIPPLDGHRLISVLLTKPQHQHIKLAFERYGATVFFFVIVADVLLNIGVFNWLFNLVGGLTCGVLLGQCI